MPPLGILTQTYTTMTLQQHLLCSLYAAEAFLDRLVCIALLDACCMFSQVHQLVEEADVVREGWNGYNVFHDTASRVAALDVGFLPSARASSAPPAKFVYLLGSDDYQEEDIPQDAFVVYQVCRTVQWGS